MAAKKNVCVCDKVIVSIRGDAWRRVCKRCVPKVVWLVVVARGSDVAVGRSVDVGVAWPDV